MKKIFSILLCLTILFPNVVFAADNQLLADKMSNIWLSPEKDIGVLENIRQVNQKKIDEYISLYLATPAYARKQVGISADDEVMKEQVKEYYSVDENNILKIYYIQNKNYVSQYANSNSFRYLISDDCYLMEKTKNKDLQYNSDGTEYNNMDNDFSIFGFKTITIEMLEFLKNKEKLAYMFENINAANIQEIKIIVLNQATTCLYVDCGTEEYIAALYIGDGYEYVNGSYNRDEWIQNIERYKLYSAKDFVRIISEEANVMNETKPTYETEAESLQADGLLKGNENGLDLLKPLTRIEATAILVRAMGYEDAQTSGTSYFADIQSDNWGAKYANIAKDKGIATGVGDDKFAPNDAITASQFATLILRNMGENPDWQTAINTFVERGLITSEQADKMDLFTRGDMAKIIYEAKQINMF